MSSGSTESQYDMRHVNGVPFWNGDMLTLRDSETAALWFRAGLKPGEQERAVARLWADLQGPAKEVVRMRKPQDFENARRVERLLRILRDSPLAAMPVPGEAAELEVTWSFDPDEAIWWCGVLDPSIPEPDVMDWSEDWSYHGSSPCALALVSDDVFNSPMCATGRGGGSRG